MAASAALPDSFGLERLNSATAEEARQVFLACCSSPRWATLMEQARPYSSPEAVYAAGDAALAALSEDDVDDALSGHARIGEMPAGDKGAWSRNEQAGMSGAGTEIAAAMADGNAAYEQKFGRVYLVSAAGLSAGQLLSRLLARIDNDEETERRVVREEFAKINGNRLRRLLAPPRATNMTTNVTTHVLDASLGTPAVGVPIRLEDMDGNVLGSGVTNDDGRIQHIVDQPVAAGDYRMIFDTGAYHESAGVKGFYPEVVISFTVSDSSQHHHVPLLLAPFAYSTYRGS